SVASFCCSAAIADSLPRTISLTSLSWASSAANLVLKLSVSCLVRLTSVAASAFACLIAFSDSVSCFMRPSTLDLRSLISLSRFRGFFCCIQLIFQRLLLGDESFFRLLAYRVFSAGGVLYVLKLRLQHCEIFAWSLDDLLSFFPDLLFAVLYSRLQAADSVHKLAYFPVQT